jgi:predicted Zn-dependent peptidase
MSEKPYSNPKLTSTARKQDLPYQKTTLDNGLRVLTKEMRQTHSVCIALFIGVGSRYELGPEAGTSHFIEHLLFRGTPRRPDSRDISEAIEGIGGILNGATDKELTFYWCKVTEDHFAEAAEVLGDMLLHSKFDPADIEKERQVIIEEINMCKDSPSQAVGLLIDETLWSGHPLGRDIAGTKETVTGIDRANLLDFLQAKYSPENMVATVTGNIRHKSVLKELEKIFSGWANTAPRPRYLEYQPQSSERLRIEKRDTEQAHLCLALPGIGLAHPERFPLDLLNVILGEGMSSRLFSEIRDKMGLAYSISSYVEHFLDTGSITVSASVDPENLPKAVGAVLDQLEQLKERIPENEMKKAREISKGRLLLRMEDSRNVAGWLGGQEILTNRILTLEEVVAIIDSITPEQLQQVAGELIVTEKVRLAVVGPITNSLPLQKLLKI